MLAALVRGGTLLIPLRSMFEQMGATVSYDAASKTVDVTKPGADVKVTVGQPEVVINGESRPLDVPPIIYQGNVLVPVRVISEGMGAYVLWVADQHARRRSLHPADAAADSGSAAAADRRRRPRRPRRPLANVRITTCSSPATTSSRRRSTTSSAPATAGSNYNGFSFAIHGACGVRSLQPAVDARRQLPPVSTTRTIARVIVTPTRVCYVTTIGGGLDLRSRRSPSATTTSTSASESRFSIRASTSASVTCGEATTPDTRTRSNIGFGVEKLPGHGSAVLVYTATSGTIFERQRQLHGRRRE